MDRISSSPSSDPGEQAGGQHTFEFTPDEEVSVAVVEALSTVEGVDHSHLEPRLYDVVDPEALDRVVETGGAEVEISFSLGKYRVTILGDGNIQVTEREGADTD